MKVLLFLFMCRQVLRVMCAAANMQDDAADSSKIIRSMFIKGHGQRDMSAQEVAHCNLNLPLVRQTVKYISLDLRLGTGVRSLNLDGDSISLVNKTITECYADRTDASKWGDGHQICAESEAESSLHSFAVRFTCNKVGKIVPRGNTDGSLFVVNSFPKIRADKKSKLYPIYCLHQLILWKPWLQSPQWSETDSVDQWEAFQNTERDLNILLAAMDNGDNDVPCLSVDSVSSDGGLLYCANIREERITFNTSWKQIHHYATSSNALSVAKSKGGPESLPSSCLRELDQKQQAAVDYFCCTQGQRTLLIGAGGSGKSEVIKHIKENLKERCYVCATTGKAAALIDGSTVHCTVNAPIKPRDMKDLSGPALENLQSRMECVSHIVIDEFSMMNGVLLYWIDKRLKQAKKCTDLFGGCSILLSGDPAQLSPVAGSPLWCDGGENIGEQELLGKQIYKQFDQVFFLKKNYRQGSAEGKELATFLANYREGSLTEDDFAWFESRSAEALSQECFAKACDEGLFRLRVMCIRQRY